MLFLPIGVGALVTGFVFGAVTMTIDITKEDK